MPRFLAVTPLHMVQFYFWVKSKLFKFLGRAGMPAVPHTVDFLIVTVIILPQLQSARFRFQSPLSQCHFVMTFTMQEYCLIVTSSITVIRCWSAFLQSSWTDSRLSSTQQLVWSVMLWRQITLHLCRKTYTGYESRKGSSTSYVSLRSSVGIVWHHPTCPTNLNKSLEWSPDSVWDHWVSQRSS